MDIPICAWGLLTWLLWMSGRGEEWNGKDIFDILGCLEVSEVIDVSAMQCFVSDFPRGQIMV
jgi:hypothetical protein